MISSLICSNMVNDIVISFVIMYKISYSNCVRNYIRTVPFKLSYIMDIFSWKWVKDFLSRDMECEELMLGVGGLVAGSIQGLLHRLSPPDPSHVQQLLWIPSNLS